MIPEDGLHLQPGFLQGRAVPLVAIQGEAQLSERRPPDNSEGLVAVVGGENTVPVVQHIAAAISAWHMAMPKPVGRCPSPSPVERISGPSRVSAPGKRLNGSNRLLLTFCSGGLGSS